MPVRLASKVTWYNYVTKLSIEYKFSLAIF